MGTLFNHDVKSQFACSAKRDRLGLASQALLGVFRGTPLGTDWVESNCGAVAPGDAYLLPALSVAGASLVQRPKSSGTPLVLCDKMLHATGWGQIVN